MILFKHNRNEMSILALLKEIAPPNERRSNCSTLFIKRGSVNSFHYLVIQLHVHLLLATPSPSRSPPNNQQAEAQTADDENPSLTQPQTRRQYRRHEGYFAQDIFFHKRNIVNIRSGIRVPFRHQAVVRVIPNKGMSRRTGGTFLLEGDDVARLEIIRNCFEHDTSNRKCRYHRAGGNPIARHHTDKNHSNCSYRQNDDSCIYVTFQLLHFFLKS